MSYGPFVAMIVTSTVIMFGLMYLNTYALDHVTHSQTRIWMVLLMGDRDGGRDDWLHVVDVQEQDRECDYRSRECRGLRRIARSQETVSDVSYTKAMIPHHSIAIMTSERAHIRDPRVGKLADGIIKAQVPDNAPDLPSYRDRGAPPPTQ